MATAQDDQLQQDAVALNDQVTTARDLISQAQDTCERARALAASRRWVSMAVLCGGVSRALGTLASRLDRGPA